MRLVVIYHRFGPYHVARLRAANRPGDFVAIEASDRDATYDWDPCSTPQDSFEHHVLFGDSDVATRPTTEVRGRTREVLRTVGPDVVAIPGWGFTVSLFALEWCIQQRIPVLLMTDSQYRDFPRVWIRELLKRPIVTACSSALVAGRRTASYVVQLGLSERYIRTGVDVVDNRYFTDGAANARDASSGIRQLLGLPSRYLLASGRFVPKKNFGRLIEAFSLLRRINDRTEWHLVILGDGELRPELQATVESLDVQDYVHLPGFRQYHDLPAYYGLAEAFLHVSTTEQWGLVVNEAMASGLPVVVSEACGCAPELVAHGDNGFLCEGNDTGSIASALERITDPQLDRPAMGRASQRIVDRFTVESFAERLWLCAGDACERGTPRFASLARVSARLMAWWLRRVGHP